MPWGLFVCFFTAVSVKENHLFIVIKCKYSKYSSSCQYRNPKNLSALLLKIVHPVPAISRDRMNYMMDYIM